MLAWSDCARRYGDRGWGSALSSAEDHPAGCFRPGWSSRHSGAIGRPGTGRASQAERCRREPWRRRRQHRGSYGRASSCRRLHAAGDDHCARDQRNVARTEAVGARDFTTVRSCVEPESLIVNPDNTARTLDQLVEVGKPINFGSAGVGPARTSWRNTSSRRSRRYRRSISRSRRCTGDQRAAR